MKIIPFTAAHTCMAQIWQYPPPSLRIWYSQITILSTPNFESQSIDGFQSRDKMAMLVHKTMANLAHVLHNNRVKFPKLFFLFCSVLQHGGNDVRWKPLILLYSAAGYKVPTIIFLIKWLNTSSNSIIWCHKITPKAVRGATPFQHCWF